jgi:hypothetical protein
MATLNKFINKIRMRVLVPEQHMAIIVRSGQVVRLAGPGYISCNRLTEEIAGFITTGPQAPVTIELKQIRSSDGHLVDIRCQIGWSFDPRRCNITELPHLIRKFPDSQTHVITGFGKRVVRDIVGSLTAVQLRLGQTPAEIEFQIQSKLYPKVRFAGITLFPPTVEQLTPPASLDNAIREGQEKKLALENESFEKQEQAKIEVSVKRTLVEAEAHERNTLTDVTIREQEMLIKIAATAAAQMELTYKWLATLSPELAKQITDTEAFRALAANGATLNLFAPLPGSWETARVPLLAQQHLLNNNCHLNGRDY